MAAVSVSELYNEELHVSFHQDPLCPGKKWAATLYSPDKYGDVCVSETSVPSSNTTGLLGKLGTRTESINLSDFTAERNNTARLESVATTLCPTGVAARFKNYAIFGNKGAFCLDKPPAGQPVAHGTTSKKGGQSAGWSIFY